MAISLALSRGFASSSEERPRSKKRPALTRCLVVIVRCQNCTRSPPYPCGPASCPELPGPHRGFQPYDPQVTWQWRESNPHEGVAPSPCPRLCDFSDIGTVPTYTLPCAPVSPGATRFRSLTHFELDLFQDGFYFSRVEPTLFSTTATGKLNVELGTGVPYLEQ